VSIWRALSRASQMRGSGNRKRPTKKAARESGLILPGCAGGT
jgi:hypothetical protein